MKTLLTWLAMVLVAVLAPVAHAEMIQIQYQITSPLQPVVTCTALLPGPVSCPPGMSGIFQVTQGAANSNNPGTPTASNVESAALGLQNISGATATIQLQISANDFTAPTGTDLMFLSHIGGTVLTGGTSNSLSFQSCIDPLNRLIPVSSLGVACATGAIPSGIASPVITSAGSYNNTQIAMIGSLSGPYGIDEGLVISLSPGAQINFSASSTLTPAAPEPGSYILIGAGLLGAVTTKRLFRKRAI